MNVKGYDRSMWHVCTNDVSGLPTLNRASVIIFVIIGMVQLSVYFSYLLICAFSGENIFFNYSAI